MNGRYSWIYFFNKVFKEVCRYNSYQLCEYFEKIGGNYVLHVNRIDPISYMAYFIAHKDLWNTAKIFGITDIPSKECDYGISSIDYNKTMFWKEAYKYWRNNDYIGEDGAKKVDEIFNNLEEFAKQILTNTITEEKFNIIAGYNDNDYPLISQVIFACHPDKYLPLDGKMMEYSGITCNLDKTKKESKYKIFCNLEEQLQKKYKGKNFWEVSRAAHLAKVQQKEEKRKNHPLKYQIDNLSPAKVTKITLAIDGDINKFYSIDEIKQFEFYKLCEKERTSRLVLGPKYLKNYVDKGDFNIDSNNHFQLTEKAKKWALKRYDKDIKDLINKPEEDTAIKEEILSNGDKDMTNDKQPLNQILYGPPGTGKTYKINSIIEQYIYPQIESVNTQDGLQYDDILRNYTKTWTEKLIFAFKINNQTEPLSANEIAELPFIKRWYMLSNYKDKNSLICSIRGEMQKITIKDGKPYARHEKDYFKKTDNKFKIIEDGNKLFEDICEKYDIDKDKINDSNKIENNYNKEELAKEYYSFCTFHQSYSYEDFIEGIRPVIKKEDESEDEENVKIKYVCHTGIFKSMCIRAEKNPDKKFFIFIDEINRGNISKIFGELITLIEDDKRKNVNGDTSIEYHTIETILPYSQDPFYVPNNLYIIGTMNTADRSIALLDTALRRRFDFEEMPPDSSLLIGKGFGNIKYNTLLDKLNENICAKDKGGLDKDHQIGHAFLINADNNKDKLKRAFLNKIYPLLEEYFYDNKKTIADVLGCSESDIDNISTKWISILEGLSG